MNGRARETSVFDFNQIIDSVVGEENKTRVDSIYCLHIRLENLHSIKKKNIRVLFSLCFYYFNEFLISRVEF